MKKSFNIYNNDCIEFMREIKDNTIDLIIADPPYNKNVARWDNLKNDDYVELIKNLSTESKRILKDNGNLFIYNQQPMASLTFERNSSSSRSFSS